MFVIFILRVGLQYGEIFMSTCEYYTSWRQLKMQVWECNELSRATPFRGLPSLFTSNVCWHPSNCLSVKIQYSFPESYMCLSKLLAREDELPILYFSSLQAVNLSVARPAQGGLLWIFFLFIQNHTHLITTFNSHIKKHKIPPKIGTYYQEL